MPCKPQLDIILIGDDFASVVYVNLKKKKAESVGIKCQIHAFPQNSSENEVLEKVNFLNKNPETSGILVQLPLPEYFDKIKILNSVQTSKDVDGLNSENIGLLFQNSPNFVPATPLGILQLLDFYKIDLIGKHVCIVGASLIIGIPLFGILKNLGATISVCDSQTKDLKFFTQNADIIISATGVANLIDKSFVKENSVLIDVGTNKNPKYPLEKNKICGDFDFESFKNFNCQITPVPGGVGPMTISALLENVVKSAENIKSFV